MTLYNTSTTVEQRESSGDESQQALLYSLSLGRNVEPKAGCIYIMINLGLDLDPNQDSHSSRILVNFSMDTSRDPNVPQVVRIPEGPSKNGPKTMREEGDRLTDIIEQAIGCRSIARSSELIPLTSNEKDNLSVLTFDETLDRRGAGFARFPHPPNSGRSVSSRAE